MPDAAPSNCPNCAAPSAGRYCAQCGQDNGRLELRLSRSLRDAAQTLFSIEGALPRTVGGLTRGRGRVARAYLDGERVRYVHPLRYAVFTCGIWWAVLNLAALPSGPLPGLIRHGNWLNLAMLPPIALGMWPLFVGGRRTWLGLFYVLLFAVGHVFLLRAIVSAVVPVLPTGWGRWIHFADAVVLMLFCGWALFAAYRGRMRWLWLRVVGALAVLVVSSNLLLALAARVL